MSGKTAGTREGFISGLMTLAKDDPRYLLVCADSLKAARATRFAEAYPERIFDVGIAEQNAVAFAAGLAACGYKPFVNTYAVFITMRACEQLRTFVAYPKLDVKFVGLNGGLYGGEREGVTHQSFEDLGIVRSIPEVGIVVPADGPQVEKATVALAGYDGPAYLRAGSGREPVVLDESFGFELGRARVIEDRGSDVALFANGPILRRVLEAAERLGKEGIGAIVVEIHTLRPLDVPAIIDVLRKTGAAVTVEDHNINGALGSAVAEASAEHFPVPLVRVGLLDVFPESGEAEALLDYFKMGVVDIVAAAKEVLRKRLRS
jgi:transketolase